MHSAGREDQILSASAVQLAVGLGGFLVVFVVAHVLQNVTYFGVGAWTAAGVYYGQSLMLGAVAAMGRSDRLLQIVVIGVVWLTASFIEVVAIAWALEWTIAETGFFVGGPAAIAAGCMFVVSFLLRWKLILKADYYLDSKLGRFALWKLFALTTGAGVLLAMGRYLVALLPSDWLLADGIAFLAIDTTTTILIGLMTLWAMLTPGNFLLKLTLPIGLVAAISVCELFGFAIAFEEDYFESTFIQIAISLAVLGTVGVHAYLFRQRDFVLKTHAT